MNRNEKAREVEARLHGSLTRQVHAPQLDRRFNAGVWARIEAEAQAQARAAHPVARKSNAGRWLMASNVVGLAVAAGLVVFFGLRMFSGADAVALPEVSTAEGQQLANIITWSVAAASIGFGLMFTPLGRWLRSEFT